jgi:hypothetical protein
METNVPGKRESRKKVAIRKVVNGEIDVWFCGIGELRPVNVRGKRLMSWQRVVGQSRRERDRVRAPSINR